MMNSCKNITNKTFTRKKRYIKIKKGVYLVFVHIGTDVAVIAVAQDRDIIEKHIRSLQTELVEPAVFGDRVF